MYADDGLIVLNSEEEKNAETMAQIETKLKKLETYGIVLSAKMKKG